MQEEKKPVAALTSFFIFLYLDVFTISSPHLSSPFQHADTRASSARTDNIRSRNSLVTPPVNPVPWDKLHRVLTRLAKSASVCTKIRPRPLRTAASTARPVWRMSMSRPPVLPAEMEVISRRTTCCRRSVFTVERGNQQHRPTRRSVMIVRLVKRSTCCSHRRTVATSAPKERSLWTRRRLVPAARKGRIRIATRWTERRARLARREKPTLVKGRESSVTLAYMERTRTRTMFPTCSARTASLVRAMSRRR